jgi:hypothetical protein
VTKPVQTGYESTYDCNTYSTSQSSNAGCGGWAASSNTYGNGMNAAGGGVYAMDWRQQGIRIWYFPPNAIPSDITSGKPTTSGWGTVCRTLIILILSRWETSQIRHATCHRTFTATTSFLILRIDSIIADDSFCGDWAGSVYTPWGCPGTCTNQVANNPASFNQGYFGVKSLKVYKATTTV